MLNIGCVIQKFKIKCHHEFAELLEIHFKGRCLFQIAALYRILLQSAGTTENKLCILVIAVC
jgi:hypothetical protein